MSRGSSSFASAARPLLAASTAAASSLFVAVRPFSSAAASPAAASIDDADSTLVQPAAVATSAETPFVTREVAQTLLSREQSEGVGARVRRSIGRPELRNFDPFLMLDEFNVVNGGGFPDHPHRGFETVTYMFPDSTGAFEHEDFEGNKGLLKPGMLQWMTAGRGILHSEMPAVKPGEVAHGLQLWINLRASEKMCEPRYQELPTEKVPKVTVGGITAHVIAGEALGTESPVYTRTKTSYVHFFMKPHQTLHQRIPAGFNSFLYSIKGKISVGTPDATKLISAHHTITLTNKAGHTGVTVSTFEEGGEFVILAGEPLNEPIVQHGPFVMNTREQILQTFRDYQEGKNGFEKAPGWRSEIGRVITDHM